MNVGHGRPGFRWTFLLVLLFAMSLAGCSDREAEGTGTEIGSSPLGSPGPSAGGFPTNLDTPRDIEVSVSVKGFTDGTGPVSFTGEGSVAPEEGLAEITFDLDEVPNAAGFYGHYDSIDVVYQDLIAFADVVPGDAPWLGIPLAEAGPVKGIDIARLREIVISNPLLLLELADSAGDGGEVDLGAAEGPSEGLTDGFAATSALVSTDAEAGTVTLDLVFPVVPSASDDIEVQIVLELGDEADGSIETPDEDEITYV
jgi:hypothetical protein